jgi:hypothetical protein
MYSKCIATGSIKQRDLFFIDILKATENKSGIWMIRIRIRNPFVRIRGSRPVSKRHRPGRQPRTITIPSSHEVSKSRQKKCNADISLKKITWTVLRIKDNWLAPDEGVLLGVLLPEALHLALQVGDNKAELPASRPRRTLHSKRYKAVREECGRERLIFYVNKQSV